MAVVPIGVYRLHRVNLEANAPSQKYGEVFFISSGDVQAFPVMLYLDLKKRPT